MLWDVKRRLAQRIIRFLKYYEKDQSMKAYIERLRKQKIKIGQRTVIYDCNFDAVYPWLITIGDDCTLTGAEILAHDDSAVLFNGKRQVGPVKIGNRVFIGRGSIILPGVTIGSNVIIGAGSIVTKNVPENVVVAGNPARVVSTVEEVLKRKEQSNRLIPHHFNSNLVENDEDAEVAAVVREWADSGFIKWPTKAI